MGAFERVLETLSLVPTFCAFAHEGMGMVRCFAPTQKERTFEVSYQPAGVFISGVIINEAGIGPYVFTRSMLIDCLVKTGCVYKEGIKEETRTVEKWKVNC